MVDDGSTDDTAEVAAAAGAVVVSHGVNVGKGSAVRTSPGYAAEHGFDAFVLLDGNGQHDRGEIPGLLEPITTSTPEALTQASMTKSLSNDAADIVTGFRSIWTDAGLQEVWQGGAGWRDRCGWCRI
ncbi:MAG: glycosyltransferase [Bacteroidetes bacterium]|nr:glycosyltransferase [Bacteroidota bacterium]